MSLKLKINKKIGAFQLDMQADIDSNRIGILGASGCGKSMTLKCIAGIESNDEGYIILDDRVLMDSSKKINLKPQQRKLGYLFQNYALFPTMTVEKNIAAGLSGQSKEYVKERVAEMIHRFRLDGLEKHIPDQLSGGQQQRTAIARIMAYEPGLIMLDEPFSALDSHLKERLLLEMQEMLTDYEGTILVVSHNREEIYQLTDSLIVMENGRIIRQGKTKDIFRDPQLMTAAKLTGCKNISAIKKLGEYRLFAEDWGIELETAEPIADDINYVGIRAHDLMPSAADEVNAFPVHLVSNVAAPFEVIRLVKKQGFETDCEIWWKIPKVNLSEDNIGSVPEYLKMPKESLLLLK